MKVSPLERQIKGKVWIIYSIAALICLVAVVYVYYLGRHLSDQKQEMDKHQSELELTGDLIYQVQEIQNSLHLYTFARQNEALNDYTGQLIRFETSIDSLERLSNDTLVSQKLTLIKKYLQDKQTLLANLSARFSSRSSVELLNDRIESYDPVIERSVQQMVTTIRKDSIIPQPRKKNFWKRLSAAFSPEKEKDSLRVVSSVAYDTVISSDPDTLHALIGLKAVSAQVKNEYKTNIRNLEREIRYLLLADQELSAQISQLLIFLHKDTLDAIMKQTLQRERVLEKSIWISATIGVVALLLIILLIYLIFHDINKGYRAKLLLQEEKERTERLMKSRHQLLLSVSHDIKSPLSSILGYLGAWKESSDSSVTDKELDSMIGSGQYILSLLRDLLEFSQLEQGKATLHCSTADILSLAEEIVEMFQPVSTQKQIPLRQEIRIKDHFSIVTDRLKVKQILINLLSNAFKYTVKGEVCFKIEEGEQALVFTVSDTGVGLAQEEIPYIFTPFSRSHTNSDMAEGSGFGLFVVKGLTDLLSGEITLSSEKGVGTSVRFVLPVSTKETEQQPISEDHFSLSLDSSKEILLVDDDPTFLLFLKRWLGQKGYGCVTCSDYQQWETLPKEKGRFGIVLTDLQLGSFSGKDVLHVFKEISADTPIVLVSASSQYNRKKALAEGFDDYIDKTEIISRLSDKIGREQRISALATTVLTDRFPLLSDMFGADEEAILPIVKNFFLSTEEGLLHLQNSVDTADFEKAQEICHRMLPMFLQMELFSLTPFLQKMDRLKGESADVFPSWQEEAAEFIVLTDGFIKEMEGVLG